MDQVVDAKTTVAAAQSGMDQAQNGLVQLNTATDALSSFIGQANSIIEMVWQALDACFGGDSKNQVEGDRKPPTLPKPQVPAPEDAPAPTVPPEIAAKAAGAQSAAVLVQPILQLLSSLMSFLNGRNLDQLAQAMNGLAANSNASTQAQNQAFQTALADAAKQAWAQTAAPNADGTVPPQPDLANLPDAAVDKLLCSPAPAIPGMVAAPTPETPAPTWGHVLDQLAKALPLTAVVAPAPGTATVPTAFGNLPKDDLPPTGWPAHAFSPDKPEIDFVADPTRTQGAVLGPAADPGARLAQAVDLARDLSALGAAQADLGAQVDALHDALEDHIQGRYRQSLRGSLLALLKSLVTFNLQADANLSPTSMHPDAWAAWAERQAKNTATPLAGLEAVDAHTRWETHTRDGADRFAGDVVLVEEVRVGDHTWALADGHFWLQERTLQFDAELDAALPEGTPYEAKVRHQGAVSAASDFVSELRAQLDQPAGLGAFPGNLLYAALGDAPTTASLLELLPQLWNLMAARLGRTPAACGRLHQVVNELLLPDEDLEIVPDLLLGAEPADMSARTAVRALTELLLWVHEQPGLALDLRGQETYVSGLGMMFVDAVLATTELPWRELATRVRTLALTGPQYATLRGLCYSWELVRNSIGDAVPDGCPEPAASLLTRVLKVVRAPNCTLPETLDLLRTQLRTVGTRGGGDLVLAATAAAAIWRSIVLLDSTLDDVPVAKRIKALLQRGTTQYDLVRNLPNHGCLSRIAEVLP